MYPSANEDQNNTQMKSSSLLLVLLILIYSCSSPKKEEVKTIEKPTMAESPFQMEVNGKKTDIYKLIGADGFEVTITNYGARIVSIMAPDKNGELGDIVLGFDDIKSYLELKDPSKKDTNFGSTIGRYANRIGNIGSFKLDGKKFNLHINDNDNILHGGFEGFHHKVWDVISSNDKSITMRYLSPDKEEGFPGNLDVNVTFSVNDQNELKVEYKATTDKPTVVNFTNHTYFNLKGEGQGTIEDHMLQINGESFLPVDSELIPTGKIVAVKGTSFDFLSPKTVGESINVKNDQLDFAKGYDHNWVIKRNDNPKPLTHAIISEKTSGRKLELVSVEPGLQFYSGNMLDNKLAGKKGKVYGKRGGFCLEPQHFPDSPNNPKFPSTRLDPGGEFYSYSIYKFSVEQ